MENNKRRMPTGEGVMEDKKFNDIVYAYLQSISYTLPYHSLLLYCHLHYMYTHLGTKHGIYHTNTYTLVSY